MDQRIATGVAAIGAGLACAAEAGLLWRANQALPAAERWKGYAGGLVTLGAVVAGWGWATGERRAALACGLIALGGGLGTVAAHALLAAQDARDQRAVEEAIHGGDQASNPDAARPARQVGDRPGPAYPSRPGLPHGRNHHRPADSGAGAAVRVYSRPGGRLSGDAGGMLPA